MKKALVLLLAIISFHSYAAAKPNKEVSSYLVKIQFSFKDKNKDFKNSHEAIVNENNHDWIPLSTGKDGVALIGKIYKADKNDVFTAEYLVVNTTTVPVTIHRMSTMSKLNQSAEIKSEHLNQIVKISLTATPKDLHSETSLVK